MSIIATREHKLRLTVSTSYWDYYYAYVDKFANLSTNTNCSLFWLLDIGYYRSCFKTGPSLALPLIVEFQVLSILHNNCLTRTVNYAVKLSFASKTIVITLITIFRLFATLKQCLECQLLELIFWDFSTICM